MAQQYTNVLSDDDIHYILSLPEIAETRAKLDTSTTNVVKFSVSVPEHTKKLITQKFGINLNGVNEIPMRWIKGDTAPHIDFGDKKFQNTYLIYLNDSPGNLIVGEDSYPIAQNTGYVFSEGLTHKTVNTGTEPRLMIGPMSENAIAVGAPAIYYFPNQTLADAVDLPAAQAIGASYVVGSDIYFGTIGLISKWTISTSSLGPSTGNVVNGQTLDSTGFHSYYLYPEPFNPSLANPQYPPPPYGENQCIVPPYNATNFTPAAGSVYSTLVNYAKTQPQYPWNTGVNAQQIFRSQQNISYFNGINLQTQAIKTQNNTIGAFFQTPYPQFKTDRERLMYIQGMSLTSARNIITGENPSAPAGVPCSTIYQIINS